MNAQADRVNIVRRSGGRGRLMAGAGVAALTLALLHAAPVRAAEYLVANDAQLRAAITAANADADPSATIVLTGSFAVANTNLPLVTKPITIDTRGHTLSSNTAASLGVIKAAGPYTTGSLTLNGTIVGFSGGVADTAVGGAGLQVAIGTIVTNNATVIAGAGGQAGGQGGRGAVVTGGTLVNNGSITAGTTYGPFGTLAGAHVTSGGTLINNGLIQGANGQGGLAGAGVDLGNPSAQSTLVNNGVIRGGSGTGGVSNVGLTVRALSQPVINTGTIEGGAGAVAIIASGAPIILTNSGTVRAGAGQATALQMGTGQLTLELQSGSVIQGNVVASAAGTTDILRLGGATSATFDVSTIGGAGQYQNLDVFQKVGTGAWTLTGTGTATTNWDIQQGVLVIGDGATSGSIIGNVANAGTLAFNRSDSVSFAGVISGTGAVRQSGSGTTTLTGVNTYTGGTFLDGGTLSVGSDANLGGAAGALNFNGGVLRWTGGSFVSTRPINWGANGGGFDVTNSLAVLRVNPALASGGALTKLGGGTLVLAGDNTYTGGTTIAAGTLQIGGGTTTGSILGDVVNNGTLAFSRSDATSFAGAITGTGSVSQIGAGTITLTGNSNYGGGTDVNGGGGLRILGATVSSGGSSLVSGGSLTVDAGGVFNVAGGIVQGATGVAGALNVRNGGVLHTTGNLTLRNAPSGFVLTTLNVSGAGSLADIGGTLLMAASSSANVNGVNITGGGKLTTGGATTMGAAAGNTTAPFITIDGAGSDWTSASSLTMTNGALSLTNGGAASFATVTTGTVSTARQGAVTVTGTNSRLTTTGDLVIGSGVGTGVLTVADGGRASAGGSILLGNGATATGVLNIGGAEGQAAAGTGAFNAASLVFGGVGSRINFNHTDPAYGFATLLSGAGAVNQVAGTTILTANNSYSGATTVSGGLLRINGDQSAATGLTSVLSGGALGGSGVIGGDVTVASGGVIAPGNSPGMLTINGDLSLAGGSLLDYEFGQSNIVGGPLNDLIKVGGDLTLDGAIDVTVTSGGNFDTGVYRILSYGGALTNNGLALGAMPAGSVVGVQTSVAGQVNLVNSAGATVNFWDGAVGPKLDGFVNGGAGVWQNSTGNDNWTDITGTFNNAYSDGSFAVFMAAPGTVTVDNGLGAVTAAGMQFASDGYTIAGGDITLVGPQSIVRVGDGTAAGAGMTATIGSALTGAAQLVKTDLGTLVLTGANSYAGGTRIDTGTLQIGDGGATGGVTGDIIDNAALVVDRSGSIALDGVISGTGSLTKLGVGALTLTGANTYTGGTTITGGVLQIGNGGATGGVAGDIVDNGALRFNRSDTLTLGGVISGSGSVSQAGPGTTILTGANSYAGATDVTSGTLLINGDQSAATALTSVASGAALGGVGMIGGSVTVADGATLAAGSNGVGTLAINGDLTLGGASRIAFEFGQAGVVGGAFNDLVDVGGALTLDGTIDVTQSAGGSYGAGVYRVLNYAGALTNNGLTVGTLPPGATAFVQTSVAGQVNLVDVGGLDLNFWDGVAGPKFNSVINGGSGVWQAHGGNDNWADASGAVNAGYSDGAVAIFSGAPGTVTVSNSLGAVTASGMQFASNGYVITGEAVALAGPQASIRVGDGSAAGAGYTATLASALTGASQLVKTDLGTLALTGDNTYTGGTRIEGGVLAIGNGGATGSITGDIVDNAALVVNRSGALTLNGAISGSGSLTKLGGGELTLTGLNSYVGGTTIGGGTISISLDDHLGAATGGLTLNSGALRTTTFSVTSDRAVTLAGAGTFLTDSALELRGAVSGAGPLIKDGAEALLLTADNGYTGGTTINAGMLQLGNGGATGSVVGNVVNNGRLAFNRSNTLALGGLISGSGSVSQAGPGATILTGANSYAGATDVTSGTLLINGDQSGATALTSVASGATLGGVGTIGGNVTVADGGTLAPGAGGAGALTINGALSLAANSKLAYDFGAANAAGSPLNDVVNIGGDLTLDGTVDVAITPGGAFDIGLYRIANYGGVLTNNGLAIGTTPAGADVFVQTSVAGQVNLVNTGSAVLNFWDSGPASNKFNNAVDGGGGAWLAATGDSWTDATGAVNAPYENGGFAIFAGAGGTVTIDNSLGAVTASGLQFASNGYRFIGGALTLTGPQSTIRVGDGTVGGSAYTAAIDAQVAGAAQLVKTDLGTLVLAGANSFTGGVAVNGGTLRIASDANLGAAAGGLSFNGGTLNTTADVSSARAINLAGQAVFSTDAGTTLTLSGNTAGAGSLGKAGAGTLVLAGAGSYTGGAAIGQGTLLVNGDHGAATGLMTVGGGATLGGAGVIGGDVSLNGTLAPGAGGVGTLTIKGDLAIGSAATLAYEFGQANVAGGALNDLVNVGGDLTLDGTINVTVPASGAFGAGIYRVFNYGGALTDNGLTLGALPAGGDVAVQTSIAGQVNLVNTSGLALSFWDGAGGPRNNGAINGGAGVWQAGGAADNWTDTGGAVNAAYSNGAFAVFGGVSGAVTVDNGLGQVSASGLQFATGGYTITGGAIALTGSQATIRVGDGSTAGAGYTATINTALSGAAQLAKTDAGTLVLGGTNSYAGGTLINGGVLQISSDANLGAATGTVTFDGGTLATSASLSSARGFAVAGAGAISTASGTTLTLTGPLSGGGTLTKTGGGALLLAGDGGAHVGATIVGTGTLRVDGVLGGATTVAAGGRLEGVGRVGSVVNIGVVAPGGEALGTLTLAGGYAGNGGTLEIATALGGDASPTDRLVVQGDTSGATEVVLNNRGGLGAQTVEGVKIVDVAGASNGAFTLRGDYQFQGDPAVIAGAYGYRLYKGGVATPADGDWYLRSALLNGGGAQVPLYQPGVPVYEAYGQTLLALNAVGTMQQRIGERRWGTTESGQPSGLWGRMQANRYRPNATVSTSLADLDVDSWTLEFGADHVLSEREGATLVLGVLAGLGEAEAKVGSVYGDGGVKTKDYSAGATLSWYGPRGFYVDSQVRTTWFDSDLRSTVLGALTDGNDGHGQAYSVELGKRSPIDAKLSFTPQVQMVYSTVGFDRFADPNDAEVSSGRGESLKTRLGLAIDRQDATSHLYAVGNLSYEWRGGTASNVSGTPVARTNDRLWGELGVGGTVTVGSLRLYTEASADTAINDFGHSYSLKGTVGLRLAF
jgi:fibronectin-binding autotransporter adhesin